VDASTLGWTVVLPVKHADRAKSRLVPPPGVDRVALARAVALDSVAAVVGCELVSRVVVVTSDPVVGASVRTSADVVPDPAGGLLAAVDAGLQRARTATPASPVGVLLADVPALAPADLAVALTACAQHPSAFVPDLEGTGTVLLTASPGTPLTPAFGEGSASRHEAGGAVRLELDLPTLRRDVDTWDALLDAVALGAGDATSLLWARAGLGALLRPCDR
jgi:2-phospho-L-lactate guanylyltransferase